VVDADEETRIARVQQRSGLSAADIRQRMAWQLPAGQQRARADMVVENSGSSEVLAHEATRVWQALAAIYAAREGTR
jgi:dephospho-CoA kinase